MTIKILSKTTIRKKTGSYDAEVLIDGWFVVRAIAITPFGAILPAEVMIFQPDTKNGVKHFGKLCDEFNKKLAKALKSFGGPNV